jgi:hypothetical protein
MIGLSRKPGLAIHRRRTAAIVGSSSLLLGAASVWVLSPVYADAGRCRSDTPSLVVQPSTSAVAASNMCQGSGLVVGKLKNLVKTRCGKDAFDLLGSAVQNKPTPTIDQ